MVIHYTGWGCQSLNPQDIHCFKWEVCVRFAWFWLVRCFSGTYPGINWDLPVSNTVHLVGAINWVHWYLMYIEPCESLILNQQAFSNSEKLRKKSGLQTSKYNFFFVNNCHYSKRCNILTMTLNLLPNNDVWMFAVLPMFWINLLPPSGR
jgi:hypothetical protein